VAKARKPSAFQSLQIGLELRKQGFEAILLLRASSRWQLASRFSRIPIRVGHTARPGLGGLTHDAWTESRRHLHIARRALDVVATALDRQVKDYPAVLRLSSQSLNEAQAEIEAANLPADYFAVQLGMGGSSAHVAPAIFAEISKRIQQTTGLVPILTGTKDEEPLATEFNSHFGSSARSLIGRTNLPSLSVLLQRSRFILSLDTGTVHLGAAVAKPSVVLMPKLAFDIEEWKPWMVDHEVVRPTQFCRECSRQGCKAIVRTCVDSFSTDEVVQACHRLLSRIERTSV
ncbi:MAG: glycosyltransferase family 9 protein, partial [Fimbriimonadaceae bacterium]|nr:glycosyltransferase family 9 protein [Fimbriimonadaceae bacterium]